MSKKDDQNEKDKQLKDAEDRRAVESEDESSDLKTEELLFGYKTDVFDFNSELDVMDTEEFLYSHEDISDLVSKVNRTRSSVAKLAENSDDVTETQVNNLVGKTSSLIDRVKGFIEKLNFGKKSQGDQRQKWREFKLLANLSIAMKGLSKGLEIAQEHKKTRGYMNKSKKGQDIPNKLVELKSSIKNKLSAAWKDLPKPNLKKFVENLRGIRERVGREGSEDVDSKASADVGREESEYYGGDEESWAEEEKFDPKETAAELASYDQIRKEISEGFDNISIVYEANLLPDTYEQFIDGVQDVTNELGEMQDSFADNHDIQKSLEELKLKGDSLIKSLESTVEEKNEQVPVVPKGIQNSVVEAKKSVEEANNATNSESEDTTDLSYGSGSSED